MAEKQYPTRIDMRAAGGPKAAPRPQEGRIDQIGTKVRQGIIPAFDKTAAGWREGVAIADAERRQGYMDTAVLAALGAPPILAARGLAQDLVGDPIGQLIRYFGRGSGGQMPETAKPKGAPKAKPEVPGKAAASVYDSMNSAWLQNLAKGGPISVNAMRGIAQTVPTPVPPLGVEDTIRADQYALLQAAYGPVIQQAQAAKDQEAFTTAYDEYAKRAALLMGVDPLQLQMLQAE